MVAVSAQRLSESCQGSFNETFEGSIKPSRIAENTSSNMPDAFLSTDCNVPEGGIGYRPAVAFGVICYLRRTIIILSSGFYLYRMNCKKSLGQSLMCQI